MKGRIFVFIKYIIFTFIFLLSIYFYLMRSQYGCKLKDASNYNPNAVIEDNSKCKYNTLGCMDKNAANYNIFATESCEEDCVGCENKGTCNLCKKQKKCSEICPTCICKPRVYGCNRTWAINYNPDASLDNGSCIGPDRILENIKVISGGDCKKCSGRASVKVKDRYLLINGKQGINVIVLKRNKNLDLVYNRGFMTGNYESANKEFVDFMRKYVFAKDIVIITIRGDAVGRRKNYNENNEVTFIQSILTEDSKAILQMLGAKNPELARAGSYILIGSFLNDIYFETYSSNNDSYFPYFNLINYGCLSFENDLYEKEELDINKFKLLNAVGDLGDLEKKDEMVTDERLIEFKTQEEALLNRADSVNRCALEALSLGYKVFSVSKSKCYVFKKKNFNLETEMIKLMIASNLFASNLDENKMKVILKNIPNIFKTDIGDANVKNNLIKQIVNLEGLSSSDAINFVSNIDNFNKFKKNRPEIEEYLSPSVFKGYFDKSEKNEKISEGIRMGNNICRLNNKLQAYGNANEESLFLIDEVSYSGIHSMLFGGQVVQLYNSVEFKGIRRDLGLGIHEAWGTIPKSENSPYDLINIPISSMRIPNDFMVTLFRNVKENEDLDTDEIEFSMKTLKDYNRFKIFDLDCCLGCKLNLYRSIDEKRNETLSYRTWEHLVKNVSFKRNEVKASIYNVNFSIEEDREQPDIDNRLELIQTFNIDSYEEVDRLKNYTNGGNVGYLEITDFEGKKLRRIDFNTWDNFYNLNLRSIFNDWSRFHIESILDPTPYINRLKFYIVDPNKEIMRKIGTFFGYESTDLEVTQYGLSHRDCTNIQKYGNCDNDESNKNPFTSDIKYLIVSKKGFGVTFWNEPGYSGLNLNLGFGKYNIPIDLSFIIRSLEINMKNVSIIFYLEYNFKKEFLKISCHDSKLSQGLYKFQDLNKYIPNNKKIKSISIEKLQLSTVISNNQYPDMYDDELQKEYYPYTFKYNLSNDRINYLTFPFDFFKDEILLNSDDKYIRVIHERYKFDFLDGFDNVQPDVLFKINSAGGVSNFGENNVKELKKLTGCIKTFDSNNKEVRRFIIYYGSWLRIENEKFVNSSFESISFNKDERMARVYLITNDEGKILGKDLEMYTYVLKSLKNYGTHIEIELNNKMVRVNFSDSNWRTLINFNVKVILKDGNQETLLNNNVTLGNEGSSVDYNIYIIRKKDVPLICKCSFDTKEYDIFELVFNRLNSFNFKEESIVNINLPNQFNKLSEFTYVQGNTFVNLFSSNDYGLLNNKFKSNRQFIVHILDDSQKINKIYYFNGQKYSINENVNNLNKFQIGNNLNPNLKISKNEKKAIFSFRTNVNEIDNPDSIDEKIFNYRQSISSVFSENYEKSVMEIGSLLTKEGIIETYNSNGNLIRKITFKNNEIESIGKIVNLSQIVFSNNEDIVKFYDTDRNKIIAMPIAKDKFLFNKFINFYKNYFCIIKLYNINREVTKVIFMKNKKFIQKYNSNYLPLDYNDYIEILDKVNWQYSKNDINLDLDDMYLGLEIKKSDKFYEVLFLKVYERTSIYDSSFDASFKNMTGNLFNKIKLNLQTIVRFYDINNKVSKTIGIVPRLIANYTFGTKPSPITFTTSYLNPIKYLEVYKSNIKYNFFQKNKLFYSIEIPLGMNGVYSYKITEEIQYANKVVRDSESKLIKVFDENNRLIEESSDDSVHNYILGIKFINYNGKFNIEYFPKTDMRVIRLENSYDNIDTIIEEEFLNDDSDNKTELDSILEKISKNNVYEFKLNRSSLRIKDNEGKFSYFFTPPVTEGGVSGIF